MTKIEVLKILYELKPTANLKFIRQGTAYYNCYIDPLKAIIDNVGENVTVNFEIPVDDMGDADFFTTMDAKLLGRWIVIN